MSKNCKDEDIEYPKPGPDFILAIEDLELQTNCNPMHAIAGKIIHIGDNVNGSGKLKQPWFGIIKYEVGKSIICYVDRVRHAKYKGKPFFLVQPYAILVQV